MEKWIGAVAVAVALAGCAGPTPRTSAGARTEGEYVAAQATHEAREKLQRQDGGTGGAGLGTVVQNPAFPEDARSSP